jgi:beta-phosphoglucomutase-like phosphatase (HAD superfamily)
MNDDKRGNSPTAIIFDGEGVVIDSEPIWDLSQREFLDRRGIAYAREEVKPLLAGRSLMEGVRVLQVKYGFGGDVQALAQERADIVRHLFKRVGFVPGFQEFFGRIRGRYKTCLATVMPSDLLAVVVESLELRSLFGPHIYCPDNEGLPSKPEPDLFLHSARQIQANPEDCVVIEDSPNGIEAANRAGMFSIGITTTFSSDRLHAADLIVSSFSDIPLD